MRQLQYVLFVSNWIDDKIFRQTTTDVLIFLDSELTSKNMEI